MAITGLQARADADRRAQTEVASTRSDLEELGSLPLQMFGGARPHVVKLLMATRERHLRSGLASVLADEPVAALRGLVPMITRFTARIEQMRRFDQAVFTTTPGRRAFALDLRAGAGAASPPGSKLVSSLVGGQRTIESMLARASAAYERRAIQARLESTVGAGCALLVLVLAFALAYRRAIAARATAEDTATKATKLASAHREQALTDALTGLPNRRALTEALEERPDNDGFTLVLLDLDGFKAYNDTLGHDAGDVLLGRVGARLTESLAGIGVPYRMGGDEFCVLARGEPQDGEAVARLASAALMDTDGRSGVGCSYGRVHLPSETASTTDALRIADMRMYEHKARRRASVIRPRQDAVNLSAGDPGLQLEHHHATTAHPAG